MYGDSRPELGQELFAADLLALAQLTDDEAAEILKQEPDSFDKPKS